MAQFRVISIGTLAHNPLWGERGDVRPVGGRAAVDHRLADAVRPGLFDRGIRDLGELVMAMGVAEFHRSARG